MMFGYLRRFIRLHFIRIPETTADKWNRRLRNAYLIFSWNACGLMLLYHFRKEKEKTTKGNNNLSDSLSLGWAKVLNVQEAEVIKIQGFSAIGRSRIKADAEIPLDKEEPLLPKSNT